MLGVRGVVCAVVPVDGAQVTIWVRHSPDPTHFAPGDPRVAVASDLLDGGAAMITWSVRGLDYAHIGCVVVFVSVMRQDVRVPAFCDVGHECTG